MKAHRKTDTDKHPLNGLFSRPTWVSWHQKVKTIQNSNEARDDGVAVASAGLYANQLDLSPDTFVYIYSGCQHLIMVALCNKADHYIFILFLLYGRPM